MEEYLEELMGDIEFDNSILLVYGSEYYLLMVEDKERKQEAIDIINNGDIVEFGCSIGLTQEEFDHYKELNYTTIEL